MAVQPGLCRTWSETPKTGFLTTRLILLPFLWLMLIAYRPTTLIMLETRPFRDNCKNVIIIQQITHRKPWKKKWKLCLQVGIRRIVTCHRQFIPVFLSRLTHVNLNPHSQFDQGRGVGGGGGARGGHRYHVYFCEPLKVSASLMVHPYAEITLRNTVGR